MSNLSLPRNVNSGIRPPRPAPAVLVLLILFTVLFASFAPAATPVVATPEAATVPVVITTNHAWLTFGLDRIPILRHPIMGNPLWQYLASLIFILLAFYFAKLLDY